MNLIAHSESRSNSVFASCLPERLLPSFIVQNKKIVVTASLALALLAICYAVVRHCLKPKFKASLKLTPPLNGKSVLHGHSESVLDGQGVLNGPGTIIFKDLPVWGNGGRSRVIGCDKIGYIKGSCDGSWVGEFQNGKIHNGTLTLSNGTVAQGIFEEGELRTGTINFSDGRMKEFRDHQLIKQKLKNGDVLDGMFEVFGDLYDGKGQVIKQNGEVHVGAFKFGRLNGQGKITFPSKVEYVGQFKDGILLNGDVTFPQGVVRRGIFDLSARVGHPHSIDLAYINRDNTFVENIRKKNKRIHREFFTDGRVKESEFEHYRLVQEITFNLSDLTSDQF